MSRDYLITQKLVDTYQCNNTELKGRIDKVLAEDRVLDGPPTKFIQSSMDVEKIEPFGVYQDYRRVFTKLYNQQEPKDGELVIGDEIVACSYMILTALKTLITCGVSKSAQRAAACRELFGLMISRRKRGELTNELIQPALRTTGDYYKNEIIRAMIDSMYTPMEQVDWYLKNTLKDGYDDTVIHLFTGVIDRETLDEEVAKIYKKACMEPSFRVEKNKGKLYNVVKFLRGQ